jgi:hypothetical protein
VTRLESGLRGWWQSTAAADSPPYGRLGNGGWGNAAKEKGEDMVRPCSHYLRGEGNRGSEVVPPIVPSIARSSVRSSREPRVLLRKKPADKTGPPIGVRPSAGVTGWTVPPAVTQERRAREAGGWPAGPGCSEARTRLKEWAARRR